MNLTDDTPIISTSNHANAALAALKKERNESKQRRKEEYAVRILCAMWQAPDCALKTVGEMVRVADKQAAMILGESDPKDPGID